MAAGHGTNDSFQRLTASAEKLFSTKGYRNTTVKDITSGAGLAVGSFYIHFRSKHQLYVHIMKKFASDLQEYLDSRGAGIEDVVERQVRYILNFIRFAYENPACYNLIFESLYIDRKLFLDYYYGYAMRYLPSVEKMSKSRSIDAGVWSYISMGIGNFIGLKVLAEDDCSEEKLAVIEKTVRHLLTSGLRD